MPKLPSIPGERLGRALPRAGFADLRQKGSHVSSETRTPDEAFRTVVPLHQTLAKGTLSGIFRQAGLSVEELLDLL